jgi:hypothetical protein
LKLIKDILEKDIDGTLDIRYGGSISKHTYVNGLSDVDSLVIINNSKLQGNTPNEVKDHFFQNLKDRIPNTNIRKGNLTVTLHYNDNIEIQLLPVLRTDNNYKIQSTPNEDSWSKINPQIFVKTLRAANMKMLGKLVPVIKIIKSIISTLPINKQINGYHTEALAIEIFSSYRGEKISRSMLKYFFDQVPKKIMIQIEDKSGQSTYVDEYLGKSYSLERKILSDTFSQLNRKIKNADGSHSIRSWKELLGV